MFYAIFYPPLVLLRHDRPADYILDNEQFVFQMASERNMENKENMFSLIQKIISIHRIL